MKKVDRVALGAAGVILITNPASGQTILTVTDIVFKTIFQFGSPINFLASGVLVGYIFFKVWSGREKRALPKKSKTKAQAYLET